MDQSANELCDGDVIWEMGKGNVINSLLCPITCFFGNFLWLIDEKAEILSEPENSAGKQGSLNIQYRRRWNNES